MSQELDRTLRTGHRTVLAMIAACALFSAMQSSVDEEPPPDPVTTTVALALAVGTIVARRVSTSPVVSDRTRVTMIVSSWSCAFAIAVLGAFLATNEARTQTGLVFALAAGIFCLRPPPSTGEAGARRPGAKD
jgi:hypothetical protein